MTDLHSDWAPSSMGRILACPASAELVKLYKNDDSDASNLGTIAHGILEDALVFGLPVDHEDIELVEGVELAVEYAQQELLKGPELHVEKRLSIAGTPVWGTSDLVFVHAEYLKITDYKHGYVPVEVANNKQLLSYLRGAIEEFGERDAYFIELIQPRFDHRDGPIRRYSVTRKDLAEFDDRLEWALANRTHFEAGAHCKYCPARGACKTFAKFLAPIVGTALYYELSDKHAVTDDTLAKLLDLSELLPGWIRELRSEAIRRTFAGKRVEGYKLVNGQGDRQWIEGAEVQLPALYDSLSIPNEAMYDRKLASPATVEKHVKGAFKGQKRGAWKTAWAEAEKLITRKSSVPALVREIDGRQQFRKGTEFGELLFEDSNDGDLL